MEKFITKKTVNVEHINILIEEGISLETLVLAANINNVPLKNVCVYRDIANEGNLHIIFKTLLSSQTLKE